MQGEQRWPVLLLRTSPTWLGVVLFVVGIAVLLDSVAVIAFFVVAFLFFGAFGLEARRRAKSNQPRKQDPEALRRIARDTHIADAAAVLIAAVSLIYFGISSGSILLASGSLLMVLGGFESRRLLRSSSQQG